jgi:hypothetical protein
MDAPTPVGVCGAGRMLTALAAAPAGDDMRAGLVRARFEALAEWGVPIADAREIAQAVTVDIVEVVGLLRRGCPPELVLAILG